MPDTDQATRFRKVRRLGAGGMATVTLAEDTVLGREVALKRLHSGGDSREMLRLKREALVGASLSHPNLVFVYDAQLQEDGDVVIVMEYVEGETLADLIRSRGALSPPEAIRVLTGVAAALDAIHERGIVHRDVKPANVLLGSDGTIKLADLGVADVADRTRITSAGAVVGSFNYMAAEQLDGAEPSPAMDVYALAAVAYEMLAGERARPESNPLALAHAISTQPPPDLRTVSPAAPPATAAVLQRAMSADPAQRPRSAGELVRRLEATLAEDVTTRDVRPARNQARAVPRAEPAEPAQPAEPPSTRAIRSRSRTPILVPALLGLAVLAVAGVVVAALSGSGGGKPQPGASTAAHGATAAHPLPGTTKSQSATTHSATSSATSATSTPSTPAPGAPSSTTPAGAVEQFYEAAASHQYATAWALADPRFRSQLGGYAAFQSQMSSVRSITFHQAQAAGGTGSDTATVAVRTTSVQADRTQQCAGTARTVRSGGAWLLDGISISCS